MSDVMPSSSSEDGTDGLGAVPSVLEKSRTDYRRRRPDGTVDITDANFYCSIVGQIEKVAIGNHISLGMTPTPDITPYLNLQVSPHIADVSQIHLKQRNYQASNNNRDRRLLVIIAPHSLLGGN